MLKRLMNPSATRLSGQNNRLNIPHLKISTNSWRVRFTFEYKFCKTPFLFQPIGETQHTPSTLTDPAPSTSVRHRCEIVHIVRSLAFHAWWGYLVAWSGEGGGVGGQLACETDTLCFSNSQPHSPPPPPLPPARVQSVSLSAVRWQEESARCCLCLPGDHLVWLYAAVTGKWGGGSVLPVSFLPGDSELWGISIKVYSVFLAPRVAPLPLWFSTSSITAA